MGTSESADAVVRARSSGGRVFASVGLHPNDLAEYRDDPRDAMDRLRTLAADPVVVGIGETGLDVYRTRETPEVQQDAFRAHIALAKECKRTLVIHCRDAHDDVLRVLDDAGPPDRVVMHCFSGSVAHAAACAERGFYCSFAGNLTYKRSEDLREAARVLPEELLLVETDAPYLAPLPQRGKSNSPAFLPLTATCLAEVRGVGLGSLTECVSANTRSAFQLPPVSVR
jgi:TatD DNase family protein